MTGEIRGQSEQVPLTTAEYFCTQMSEKENTTSGKTLSESHVLLTSRFSLGKFFGKRLLKMSRARLSERRRAPAGLFIKPSLRFLLSSLTSAPQQASTSIFLHVPGNTDVTLKSGFLLQQ